MAKRKAFKESARLIALRSDPEWVKLQQQLRAGIPPKHRARPHDWPGLKAYAWQFSWYSTWYMGHYLGIPERSAQVEANKIARAKLKEQGLEVDAATFRDWLREERRRLQHQDESSYLLIELNRRDVLSQLFMWAGQMNSTQRLFGRQSADSLLAEWLRQNRPNWPRDPIPMEEMSKAVVAGFLNSVIWALSTYDDPSIHCAYHDEILCEPDWPDAFSSAIAKLERTCAAAKRPWDQALTWLLNSYKSFPEAAVVAAVRKSLDRLSTGTKRHLRSLANQQH
jgi:hypothetical protein